MSENFENKLGKVFDSEIQEDILRNKEMIEETERLLQETCNDLQANLEWLELQQRNLEIDKELQKDPDFNIDEESLKEQEEYVKEIEKEIDEGKKFIAELTIGKAAFQSAIDRFEALEQKSKELFLKLRPGSNN